MPNTGRFISSTRLIAILTLASRVLGLLREAVLGYFFATSELLSAFRIAFMTPNLLRRLFGEGALSSAMIPVLTETLQKEGEQASRRLVGGIVTRVTVLLVGLVIVGEIGILAWRAYSDDQALKLAAIMIPFMALTCTVAIGGGALNVLGHFATPAAVPIILNLSMIVCLVGASVLADVTGFELMVVACVSVLIGGALQVLATGAVLRKFNFLPRLGWFRGDPHIRSVGRLMLPMILGLSAVQINALVDYVIAYAFVRVDGERVGPAVLGFAQYLYQLPLGVFGIAVATAVFPALSRKAVEGDRAGLADILQRGIRLSLFIALPAAVGLIFVAEPLVSTLFERGAFESKNSGRVAGVLVMYSLGIPAYFAHHLFVRAFYSVHESKKPARIALSMVGVNLVMNLSLVGILQERGLALATAICAMIQVVWLASGLRRNIPELRWSPIVGGIAKTGLATAFMGGALYALMCLLGKQSWYHDVAGVQLALLLFVGVVSFTACARLLGIDELRLLLRRQDVEKD